jgi:hypothetical protein
MKKYIILSGCILSTLNGMELDVQTCHKHGILRAPIFLRLLEKNNIAIDGITILHPECATGALSAKLAEKADRVHGFDQAKEIIHFAYKQYSNKNLSFEHSLPEQFTTNRLFNLVVIDSYIDFIPDQQALFQRINNCLPNNLFPPTKSGELFITITTSDNKPHPKNTTAKTMAADIQKNIAHFADFSEEEIIDLMIPPYPSLYTIQTMLKVAGFEIITSEEQSDHFLATQQELEDIYRSIIMGMSIFEFIPPDWHNYFITEYIKKYIATLKETADHKLVEPIITTVIHARKVKDVS